MALSRKGGRLRDAGLRFSLGFVGRIVLLVPKSPLRKAQGYAQLHPSIVVFNDLKEQEVLHDRRLVYQRLQENGVPVPTYTVYNAEEAATTTVEESEDYLEINGVRKHVISYLGDFLGYVYRWIDIEIVLSLYRAVQCVIQDETKLDYIWVWVYAEGIWVIRNGRV